ncbi:MAG: acyl-CoA dehydrogenase family protein [Sulfobacillus sp.]
MTESSERYGFQPSEETAQLRLTVRRFIDQWVIPREEEIIDGPDGARVLKEVQARAKQEGLWALGLPKEIGGAGLPFVDYVYINEVIGRSEAAMPALGTHQTQDTLMLYHYGTEQQKRQWIPGLVDGSIWPSVAMTEPEVAGSDPTLIQTDARIEDGLWVINGHKWFATYANQAAFTTVFCITDPDAPRHRRASMILVPTDTPGYEVVRVVKTMGHQGGNHCELRLTNVRVPLDSLIGPRGQGFAVAQSRLGPGRIYHAMRWLGQAQRAFDLMCQRALTRQAHGSSLAEKQFIQGFIADSVGEIEACRLLTLQAAYELDKGHDARVAVSLVKYVGAQMLHHVVDRAIQVHGALGLTEDTPLERMYREARYARIYDGPDEVHRMMVAREVLKRYQKGQGWDPGADQGN